MREAATLAIFIVFMAILAILGGCLRYDDLQAKCRTDYGDLGGTSVSMGTGRVFGCFCLIRKGDARTLWTADL